MSDARGAAVFMWLMVLGLTLSGFGQEIPDVLDAEPERNENGPGIVEIYEPDEAALIQGRTADLLASLFEAIRIKERQFERIRNEWREAETDIERESRRESMEEVAGELRELRWRFQETASGVDLTLFEEAVEKEFSWERKLGEILEPILAELESMTEDNRRIVSLRNEVDVFSRQEQAARRAIANIEHWQEIAADEALTAAYEDLLARWRERAQFAASRVQMARLQLENLERDDRGVVDATAAFIRKFIQQRGLNLLFGVGAALAVFFAVRLMIFLIRRIGGNRNPNKLSGRIFMLSANLLAIVGSMLAMMVVFSATGDLFLFAIVVLFLLGASWAGIKVLPQFIESLKLILNIGMVREHERLLYDGIPWNVQSLGFRSLLYNERLDQGSQFLPVRALVGLHSRPWCEGEESFPCRRGDWVQLEDERIGEIMAQNPGHVTMREWGGARITYQTPDFLSRNPRLLSADTFRIKTGFGIDYRHIQECTEKIPAVMQTKLENGLTEVVSREMIQQVNVYFTMAGASSLDYQIHIVFSGDAAPSYELLHYAIHKILVESCNEYGWIIPFQQITVHQADSGRHE